jgi:L-asparagine transporter-like permease
VINLRIWDGIRISLQILEKLKRAQEAQRKKLQTPMKVKMAKMRAMVLRLILVVLLRAEKLQEALLLLLLVLVILEWVIRALLLKNP